MSSLEKRFRRPGAEPTADTASSTRQRRGGGDRSSIDLGSAPDGERSFGRGGGASDGHSVSSSLLSSKKKLAGVDDGLDGPMGWSNRKILWVGLMFLFLLWIACFLLSSLMIAVLLRVTY